MVNVVRNNKEKERNVKNKIATSAVATEITIS